MALIASKEQQNIIGKRPKFGGKQKLIVTDEMTKQVYDWAKEGLYMDIIAGLMQIDLNTVNKHFNKVYLKGRSEYKHWLKQAQQKAIDKGSEAVLIHQSKVNLGENEKAQIENIQVFAVNLTTEQKAKVKAIKSQLKLSKPCVSNEL